MDKGNTTKKGKKQSARKDKLEKFADNMKEKYTTNEDHGRDSFKNHNN